ncbi:MAG: ROK family protein [Metamycoplasmataceae bacterium]
MSENKKNYLIFDIGGTFIKWSVINNNFLILKNDKYSFDAMMRPGNELLDSIGNKIKEVSEAFPISAIGISTAGDVEPDTSLIIGSTPNHKNYTGLNIRESLSKYTNLPIFVENDANAAVIGESVNGNLKKYNSGVLLTLGTDIGGGIMINKKLFRGYSGSAGEVGYFTVDGKRWGTYFSARGLIRLSEKLNIPNLTPENILISKDPKLIELSNYWYNGLAIGIANIISLLNVEAIVIGGGLSESGILDFQKIKKIVDGYLEQKHLKESFTILKSLNGNQASIDGMCEIINKKEFK